MGGLRAAPFLSAAIKIAALSLQHVEMQVILMRGIAAGGQNRAEEQAGGGGDGALERTFRRAILAARFHHQRFALVEGDRGYIHGIALGMLGNLAIFRTVAVAADIGRGIGNRRHLFFRHGDRSRRQHHFLCPARKSKGRLAAHGAGGLKLDAWQNGRKLDGRFDAASLFLVADGLKRFELRADLLQRAKACLECGRVLRLYRFRYFFIGFGRLVSGFLLPSAIVPPALRGGFIDLFVNGRFLAIRFLLGSCRFYCGLLFRVRLRLRYRFRRFRRILRRSVSWLFRRRGGLPLAGFRLWQRHLRRRFGSGNQGEADSQKTQAMKHFTGHS
ncbi:hypothetical protein AT6N2_C3348 [Agrobacterium tumefaciens]|nr:hypothetical protein AT6N2_C3348 [Agrobacterium tumefaciens]